MSNNVIPHRAGFSFNYAGIWVYYYLGTFYNYRHHRDGTISNNEVGATTNDQQRDAVGVEKRNRRTNRITAAASNNYFWGAPDM